MNPRRSPLLVAALAVLATALVPSVAEAKKKGPKITVMTRNVFLGADLSPAIGASSLGAAIDGAGVIWNELQRTKFAERAKPLAGEIKHCCGDRRAEDDRSRGIGGDDVAEMGHAGATLLIAAGRAATSSTARMRRRKISARIDASRSAAKSAT